MRNKFKSVLITFMLAVTVLFVTACSGEETPYDVNNEKGYNVSVRYDANGGIFATNTEVIIDSYNISGMATNANGKVELALIEPNDPLRGDNEAFNASKKGYFLAGWYTGRTENGTDSDGNVIYTYSGRWDFKTSLWEVDPNGTYSADEPVVTLYAAWVPLFEVNYYYGEGANRVLLGTETYNPMTDTIEVPMWSKKTGGMDMRDFPDAPAGYTFDKAYYEDGTLVDTEELKPLETLDLTTGTASDRTMDIQLEFMEGEWYRIETAEQLYKAASSTGSYEILADLDFADQRWPSDFAFGTFTGTFKGNGHKISNVTVETRDAKATYGGLFGEIAATATIENVTFENITYKLKTTQDKLSPSYGIFAGKITSGATISNVTLTNGTLLIDSDSRITDVISIGLVCGNGSTEGITYDLEQLTAKGDGYKEDSVQITLDGEQVIVVIG